MKIIKLLLVVVLTTSGFLFLESLIFSSGGKQVNYITVGDIGSPIGKKNGVPPGGISVLDFEKPVPENVTITTVKFATADEEKNRVRLKIWRLIDNEYKVVAKSELFSIARGLNSFEVENIKAKKGDFLGIFMELNEIDRSSAHLYKGRVYVVGDNDIIPKGTVYKDTLCGFTFQIQGVVTAGD